MKSAFLNFIYLIGGTLIIASCAEKKSRFFVALDQSTNEVILSYVKDNNIDLKSKVITTYWVVNDYRTDVYVSNSYAQLYKKPENAPTYYSIINENIVVFLYVGIERIISRDTHEITKEIDELLRKREVRLSPDSGYFYHAPKWLYTTFGEKNRLVKKLPPYEYNFIPYDYAVLQDTTKKDSLYILNRKFIRFERIER